MLRVFVCLSLLVLVCSPVVAKVIIGEHVTTEVATPHPYTSSGAPTPELTWTDEVRFPGATYVALHFARFELAPGDYVIIRSPDGQQSWTYTGLGKRDLGNTKDGFFAAHIKGETAIVELFTMGSEASFGYQIDKYGRGYNDAEIEDFWAQGLGEKMNLPYPPSTRKSICTADDTEEAKCLLDAGENDVYEKGRAVVRLLQNGNAHCTGWLIGCDGHIMTNEHCIGSQAQANNIDFEFMAEGATCGTNCASSLACPGTVEASGGTLVAFDAPLDYAMVLPDTTIGGGTDLVATYGFMQLRDTGAVLGEQIYIAQHPAGWGKRFAFSSTYPEDVGLGGNTYATSLTEAACSGGANDVGYWADTQGGSSGSPVLGYSDHRVVALHHCRGSGFCTTGGGSDDRNRGVPIEAVIASLGNDIPGCAVCDPVASPVGLTATASASNTVELAWSVSRGGNTSYNVYRSEGACPASDATLLVSGLSSATYIDNTASSDTLWSYYVTTVDDDNGCESEPSPCAEAASFTVGATPAALGVCAPADAVTTIDIGQIGGFNAAVGLATTPPAGTSSAFGSTSVTPPGSTMLTISNTGSAAPGNHLFDVTGTGGSPAFSRAATVSLDVYTAAPAGPGLTAPANGATGVAIDTSFDWSSVAQGDLYDIQISTNPSFSVLVDSASGLDATTYTSQSLVGSTEYYWRVRATNPCGDGAWSAAFSLTTVVLPGDCNPGDMPQEVWMDDFETLSGGWTTGGDGSTWALDGTNTHSGVNAYHGDDVATISDQYLISPQIVLPAGQSPLTLQFWNYQELEDRTGGCWDGGVLEISTDGTTWTRLETELLTDPYDGPFGGTDNPLAGENGWCGDPQDWLNSIVDIDAWQGQTVQFRFRLATDASVSHPGWWIDDVRVRSCGGGNIFADNFDSGDASAWVNTSP